jgi:carbon-monoxide dehydrogenase medium subunit
VYPAPFDYEVAESVGQAVELMQQHGEDAKLISGGQSLIPLMRLRLADPAVLVDLGGLTDLSYIREAGYQLAIGALTHHREIHNSPLVREHCGILSQAAGLLGDPSVQHRGTIGGALAHGDPSGDLPAVVRALEAEITAQGPRGERTIPARDLFVDYLETALAEDEVVTEVRVPKLGPDTGWSYQKFSRRSQDWAIVGVAAVVERSDGDGNVGSARVGLAAMGSTPIRASSIEQALSGAPYRDLPRDIVEAANAADEGTSPASDTAASEEYRRHLAKVMTRRALQEILDH